MRRFISPPYFGVPSASHQLAFVAVVVVVAEVLAGTLVVAAVVLDAIAVVVLGVVDDVAGADVVLAVLQAGNSNRITNEVMSRHQNIFFVMNIPPHNFWKINFNEGINLE